LQHQDCKGTALFSLARILHESPAATTDMAVLPGVLGCRSLRRTVQVRKATPCGCPVARPSLWSRDSNSRNIRARGLDGNAGTCPGRGSWGEGLRGRAGKTTVSTLAPTTAKLSSGPELALGRIQAHFKGIWHFPDQMKLH
jgi:hypothetical protein